MYSVATQILSAARLRFEIGELAPEALLERLVGARAVRKESDLLVSARQRHVQPLRAERRSAPRPVREERGGNEHSDNDDAGDDGEGADPMGDEDFDESAHYAHVP